MHEVKYRGRVIGSGDQFEVRPGEPVTFVLVEGNKLVLRNETGTFKQPITHDGPQPLAPPTLTHQRVVLQQIDDAPEFDDGTMLYRIIYKVCVPGGWEPIMHRRARAFEGHEGVYDNVDDIAEDTLRAHAQELRETVMPIVKQRPAEKLWDLAMKVDLQEGTGEPGGWDDPGVATDMVELMRKANVR